MVPGAGIDFRLAGGGGCEIGRGVAAGSEAIEDDAEVASPGIRFGGVGGLYDGAEHHVDRRYVGLDQRRVEIERHRLPLEQRMHARKQLLERPLELADVAEVEAGQETAQ